MEKDNVNHPEHYTKGPECIDMMLAVYGTEATIDFCICNAFKYYWRHSYKNGQEDIEKALWYLDMAMKLNGLILFDATAYTRYTNQINNLGSVINRELAHYIFDNKEN